MPRLGWRWLLAFSSLPSLMLLIFYVAAPESPRYLCMQNRMTDALDVLQKVAKMNRARLPHGTLITENENQNGERTTFVEECQLLALEEDETNIIEHEAIINQKGTPRMGILSSLYTLLSPQLFKPTMLLWVVFFGNAFSYYGLVLLTSGLSSRKGDCFGDALSSKTTDHANLYRNVLITSLAGMCLRIQFVFNNMAVLDIYFS